MGIGEMMDITKLALSQYGVMRGSPEWQSYINYSQSLIDVTGMPAIKLNWCSIFMNWLAYRCSVESAYTLAARGWLGVGDEIDYPQMGDVVIYWRESPTSWKGHVGVFVEYNHDFKRIYTLGGNQDTTNTNGGMVCVRGYDAGKVLGFRRLGVI